MHNQEQLSSGVSSVLCHKSTALIAVVLYELAWTWQQYIAPPHPHSLDGEVAQVCIHSLRACDAQRHATEHVPRCFEIPNKHEHSVVGAQHSKGAPPM